MLDPELLKHLNDRRPIPREWVNFPEIGKVFENDPHCHYPREMADNLRHIEIFDTYAYNLETNRIYLNTWSIPISSIMFGNNLESIEEC